MPNDTLPDESVTDANALKAPIRADVPVAARPGDTSITADERTRMEQAIRTVDETLGTVTAERDALTARVMELEQLARTAAAQVASALAERDRLAEEHDRLEDERTRARTKANAAATERDRAREELVAMTARLTTAETRAAVLEAVNAERDQRIGDLRRALSILEAQLANLIAIVNVTTRRDEETRQQPAQLR
jgi:chromosome segregation ATPase